MDEILKYNHSNTNYSAVLSCAGYYVVKITKYVGETIHIGFTEQYFPVIFCFVLKIFKNKIWVIFPVLNLITLSVEK